MILLFTVFAYGSGILTSKSIFVLILVSKLWPKMAIFAYLRAFWRPFWKAPSIGNQQNFENILRVIALYWFYIHNCHSDFKKHFFFILLSKLWPKIIIFAYFGPFWQPFWKAPSIENLQNFEFILRAIAFYCFCVSNRYSDVKKQSFPHFIVQIMTKYDNFCLL